MRKYTDDPVKPEDLETILDCGRYAPCGINRQGWRFIVVTDPAVREKIYEANKRFCKFILQAPVLVVVAVVVIAVLWRWFIRVHSRLQIAFIETLEQDKGGHH